MSAREVALATMQAALPDGCPMPGRIMLARFHGKNKITADVLLFDGERGTACFSRWAFGWSYGWERLPGGDISFEGGAWKRSERRP